MRSLLPSSRRTAALLLLVLAPTAALADGGPDDFGYTYADSLTGSVTVAWQDVREDPGAVELLLGDDEASDALEIGFLFVFYGLEHELVYVHSNGFLTFEPASAELLPLHELCATPHPGDLDGAIAFYARDWTPEEGGTIHVLATGTAPDRVFVVQFTGVPRWTGEGGLVDPMTVQAILHEGTNAITVQVLETDDTAGGEGMIGIESPDGLSGLAVAGCLEGGSLPAETAFRFAYPATDLAAVPHRRERVELPGRGVDHVFTVYNRAAAEATLPIAVTSAWEVVTTPADEIVVPAAGSAELVVRVSIPDEAVAGDSSVAVVTLAGPEAIELRAVTGVQRPREGDFQRVADLPQANDQLVVGLTDEAVWTAGGRTLAGDRHLPLDVLARYDIATDTWTTSDDGALPPLPDGRFLAAGCVLADHLYVAGGFTSEVDDATGAFRIGESTLDYDVAAASWGSRAPLPGPRAGAMAACDEAAGRMLLFGGFDVDADLLDALAYDPAQDTWTTAGTLTASRTAAAVAQIDPGTIVLAGGFRDGHASASVEAYDAATWSWTPLLDLPDARTFAVGAAFDGEMCVASGHAARIDRTDFLCLAADLWIVQKDSVPTPVLPAGGGIAASRMYVVGGQDLSGDLSNAVQRWPPAPLPDAGADAGGDGDADGDGDGDTDADAGTDADGGVPDDVQDDRCCTVAPGKPGRGRAGLVAIAAALLLRRRSRRSRRGHDPRS